MNTTATLRKPAGPLAAAKHTRHRTNDADWHNAPDSIQEFPMTTFDQLDEFTTEPLAPDEPSPPGRDVVINPVQRLDTSSGDEFDESLAARAPVARCADGNGTMTGLFFSDNVVDIARAKAMCALCPLRFECLADAIDREEPWGVWGGELLSGGRIVANKRPCGRPPKLPRPEVVYDEMGPVGVVA